MSIFGKIASLFEGKKVHKTEQEELSAEQSNADNQEALVQEPVHPALLNLPPEHPIHQLYHLWSRKTEPLPAEQLCLDQDEALPVEWTEREVQRVVNSLPGFCNARLKKLDNNKSDKTGEGQNEEEEETLALDAEVCLFISSDKLFVWAFIFPPVGQGKAISSEVLNQALTSQKITYGIDTGLVDRLPKEEDPYFRFFRIAEGKPAVDGANGSIVDSFPREVERVLQVDEYDQGDYTALNQISMVKKGQEICRMNPPTKGEPGRTVLNQEIPAKPGKALPLPKGRNTEPSKDGMVLLASSDGHLEFVGNCFHVKPILEVSGNVDFSTGDINFFGDIKIQGDVLSGFTVRSMGSVHISGVIEAGSTVEAGGDLVVVKGILGDGTSVIRANGNIFSKFIEHSTVYAQKNLQTDCIMNGDIYCDGEVQVRSGRGSIVGGKIWAGKKVNATTVGSSSECKTTVVLGGSPCTDFERQIAKKELKELEEKLEKLESQPDNPAKASLLRKAQSKKSATQGKLTQLDESLKKSKDEPTEKNTGRLECSIAYPGTEVIFGEEIFRIRELSRQCIIKMVDGEIVRM